MVRRVQAYRLQCVCDCVSEKLWSRAHECTPHLYQSLLHGSPIGNPPSTLQHQVRVRVAFGLTVFRQRLPLVQLLRTAGCEDRRGVKGNRDEAVKYLRWNISFIFV